MKAYYADEKEIDLNEYTSAPDAERLFDLLKHALNNITHVSAYASKQNDNSIRKLKITEISYASERLNSKFIPFIRLTGRWLEKAGFKAGEHAQIITINGMMLIVLQKIQKLDFEQIS